MTVGHGPPVLQRSRSDSDAPKPRDRSNVTSAAGHRSDAVTELNQCDGDWERSFREPGGWVETRGERRIDGAVTPQAVAIDPWPAADKAANEAEKGFTVTFSVSPEAAGVVSPGI